MIVENTAARSRPRSVRRIGAAAALALLLPMTALAWLYVLSTPEYGRCLTYGEQCDPASESLMPIAWWSFWASAATGVAALLIRTSWTATARLRPALVTVQVALLVATQAAVVLSG
ncbi:hypothetical protein GWI34_19880 [Actinomadura sp. DSM 109109]|nr:hypothetical protein [Actinomadura lepetitiana]